MLTILRSLQRLLRLFEDKNIPYMIIGGYALPFYGRIRTTIDLDLAVRIRTEKELEQLHSWVHSIDFEATISHPQNPVIVVVDQKEKVEIELWLKPDGIVFDDETLRRRRKVKLDESIEAWITSPEDFIVNKLARPDRGVIDEQDVKSVLVRQEGKLDKEYLRGRARDAGVLTVLETIQALVSRER
ncbi:MAG: nucleotidyltransferase [Candidatus Bathyarchaeia archaeon]